MTVSIGKSAVMAALLCSPTYAYANEKENADNAIAAALSQIRDAALASNPDMAASVFAEDLALVSQSGKLYGKEAALFDLRNGFETWDNSDVVVREKGDMTIVTFVNNRTRTNMEPAKFLVMQVWRKNAQGWLLSAQSSTRIKRK
ncbi:nuclear transport factor 2 family protein [Parasphingorhabdus sp. JC815]|uniref:nuclear transport factor 2 family protein n=1 Tax=Parasphingorhabdus sp. JC815 TaxID=3232140 RepID=UPI00345AD5E8